MYIRNVLHQRDSGQEYPYPYPDSVPSPRPHSRPRYRPRLATTGLEPPVLRIQVQRMR